MADTAHYKEFYLYLLTYLLTSICLFLSSFFVCICCS